MPAPVCFKSFTPSACLPWLPPRSRIGGNVLICGALVQPYQSAMSRNTNLIPGNQEPFFVISPHRKRSACVPLLPVLLQRKLPLWPIKCNYLFFVTEHWWAPWYTQRLSQSVQPWRGWATIFRWNVCFGNSRCWLRKQKNCIKMVS